MGSWQEFSGLNRGYVLELTNATGRTPRRSIPRPARCSRRWTPPAEDDRQAAAGTARAAAEGRRRRQPRASRSAATGTWPRSWIRSAAEPPGDPSLLPETHGLTDDDLRALPATPGLRRRSPSPAPTMLDAIDALRRVYCSTTATTIAHVFVPDERDWLRQAAEGGRFRAPADPIIPLALLDRLTQVEAFERFLHRMFPGKTRFSIEGLDMLVPILDEVIGEAAESGIRNILIGMAHRGRLNVMAHVLNKPYAQILAEFKEPVSSRELPRGHGVDRRRQVPRRRACARSRAASGWTSSSRCRRTRATSRRSTRSSRAWRARPARSPTRRGAPQFDPARSLPILIHGDAAFPGQGVVAETLNLSRLPGYSHRRHDPHHRQQPARVHDRRRRIATARRTRAAWRAASRFPIVHVNADDPEACVEAARLAVAYRARFQRDFLIDLIGYRRYGHNEGDEPAFTQPLMYQKIAAHPTVRELWAQHARRARRDRRRAGRRARRRSTRRSCSGRTTSCSPSRTSSSRRPSRRRRARRRSVETAVPLDRLRELNAALLTSSRRTSPSTASSNASARSGRSSSRRQDERTVDWASAEELALRLDPRRRRQHPPDRRGRRARHVQPSPCGVPRRADGPRARAAAGAAAGARRVRDPQQPADRERASSASSTATTSRSRRGS